MTESLYQQVITLLISPPGNFVYHLVLAFSIAGALPGALIIWQRDSPPVGRRMFVGLCLLFLVQLVLIINSGLAQLSPDFNAWLPILDRGVAAFSLVILIWMWAYPDPSRIVDVATLLLSLLILMLAILTGFWWLNGSPDVLLNGSLADIFWVGFCLVLSITGGLLLAIHRPPGYGLGLGMFTLLFVGQLVYLLNPFPVGNYPGVIRLTQITAYPLLLTLPFRFKLGTMADGLGKKGIDPVTFQKFITLAARTDTLETYQAATLAVCYALSADISLLISPPSIDKSITLYCGYNLPKRELIDSTTFDSQLVPVLSESLHQGHPLHLPVKGEIPDLVGFGKILDYPLSGSLLAAPVFTKSGEFNKAIVLISPPDKSSWTVADQNYLADITRSLSDVFDVAQEQQLLARKLIQSEESVAHLEAENNSLKQNLAKLSIQKEYSAKEISTLQSKLHLALDEIASLKITQKKDPSKESVE